MLLPKKVKFRKVHRGISKGLAIRGSTVSFGEYALKVLDRGLITSRQIESARKAITHKTKRGGKLWINMKAKGLLTKNAIELKELHTKLRGDFEKCVMDLMLKKDKNVKKSGFIKKEIARVNTALAAKEFENA